MYIRTIDWTVAYTSFMEWNILYFSVLFSKNWCKSYENKTKLEKKNYTKWLNMTFDMPPHKNIISVSNVGRPLLQFF